ncbi:MAG: ABC transporter ATP-binding protein [Legionellaceae bacterium]|nr:ABC transporter ATP-binding protein [Legionellaceae bacterium]
MIKKEMRLIISVLDRATLLSIAMMSILVSLLSLSIPLAAQTLINLIAFGKLFQPVITLSLIVFVLMIALGALDIWQMVIIEVIQQKLTVKISIALTNQFTHLSLDNFSSHHGPELVNRYFEIFTINKALASLLLYGIGLNLQLFFGLLLLLFYHPLFLVFDGLIILGVLLSVLIPYRKGMESARQECSKKHAIGAWLEEILLNRYLFRFNLYHRYAIQQTDKKLVAFLIARNAHFWQLIKHQIGFYGLAAIASGLLLVIGGYLVIHNQLSLGQLVAAEIVLGALIYAFKRFGVLLENYYDLVAAADKIDKVLDLPIEQANEHFNELFAPITSIQLKIKEKTVASVTVDNPLLIHSPDPERCDAFTEGLLGFRTESSFEVLINHIFCTQAHRIALRNHSLIIGQPQWFVGTFYDNLVLNQRGVSDKTIINQLRRFGLLETVMQLDHGLNTVMYEWQTLFSQVELIKLMIVRALLLKPQLLIIDRALDFIDRAKVDELMTQLRELKNTLLIVVSQHSDFKQIPNGLVIPS